MSFSLSFDLITKTGSNHWYWEGKPMTTADSIRRRIKRMQNRVGTPFAWKIVLMTLDQDTGEVVQTIFEQGIATPTDK